MEARVHGNAVLLEWRDLAGEEYDVFRSTHESGGFEFLAKTAQHFLLDESVRLSEPDVRYHYRIRARVGTAVTETGAFTYRLAQPDRVARKMIREFETILRVMKNPPMHLLVRRRASTKCPDCWNPVTRKVRYADCPSCDGTGEVSGYHRPVKISVSRDISSMRSTLVPEDGEKVELTPISGWCAPVPSLAPDDVLVDGEGQRYLVLNVETRTKSQAVIRYQFQAVPLEKGHPAYNVTIEEDVR